LTCQTPP
jgi:demethylmenaquinone methyltransferase/2-methoxy-6-polyprenyl-1,4-benzoquinol methylase